MEVTKGEVKVHGMWASPWVRRVTIALKMKGIPYQYYEEDLSRLRNKSKLLLQYNPVKKLVPVLVHNGKPVAESLIILEYIDEIWNHDNNSPKLFPQDPYQRATIRVWASFIDLQLFEKLRDVMKTRNDDEEKKVIMEIQENMSKLEANVKDLHSSVPLSHGEKMGILDILMVTLLPVIKSVEEALGVNFIDPKMYPLSFSWMRSRDGVAIVQETTPNHENWVKYLRNVKQYFRKKALSQV